MKHLLITTIAAVVLVGCGESQPPEPPDISIHDAVEKGNIEAVKQHLDAGTDVNAKDDAYGGQTPLHNAAWKGHKEIAELLIAEGVDVDAKDDRGETPLYGAAFGGHKEIVELLISKGADVNAKNKKGRTPVDRADFSKQKETADLLRKHGGMKHLLLTTIRVKGFVHSACKVRPKLHDFLT